MHAHLKVSPSSFTRSPVQIIFEDQDLLILHKPAGVVVNRAQTVVGETIQDWISANIPSVAAKEYPTDWIDLVPDAFTGEFGTPQSIFDSRTGIAHRLDKDTSGVFVCAKHPGALVAILDQFKARTVTKKYTCLTHGKFALPKGDVSVPIGRRSSNRKLFAVVADGRSAVTQYEVKEFFRKFNTDLFVEKTAEKKKRTSLYQGFSLVSCWPKTGRTHQIRVHMAHLQHPLVGDTHYVGKKRARLDTLWCPRQFLHAAQITFIHPRTQKKVTFEAPLPTDLQEVLEFVQ